MITVIGSDVNKNKTSIEVDETASGAEMRSAFISALGISDTSMIKLIFKGKIIKEDDKISDHNIVQNSVIFYVVAKPAGGSGSGSGSGASSGTTGSGHVSSSDIPSTNIILNSLPQESSEDAVSDDTDTTPNEYINDEEIINETQRLFSQILGGFGLNMGNTTANVSAGASVPAPAPVSGPVPGPVPTPVYIGNGPSNIPSMRMITVPGFGQLLVASSVLRPPSQPSQPALNTLINDEELNSLRIQILTLLMQQVISDSDLYSELLRSSPELQHIGRSPDNIRTPFTSVIAHPGFLNTQVIRQLLRSASGSSTYIPIDRIASSIASRAAAGASDGAGGAGGSEASSGSGGAGEVRATPSISEVTQEPIVSAPSTVPELAQSSGSTSVPIPTPTSVPIPTPTSIPVPATLPEANTEDADIDDLVEMFPGKPRQLIKRIYGECGKNKQYTANVFLTT
jgi:hypothetical protein